MGCYYHKHQKGYVLSATLTQQDEKILKFVRRIFKSGSVSSKIGTGFSTNITWQWKTSSLKAYYFLVAILPFIKMARKRRKIKAAINLWLNTRKRFWYQKKMYPVAKKPLDQTIMPKDEVLAIMNMKHKKH